MEKQPALTPKQLHKRVEDIYSLLKEKYRERPKETVQGAAAVLHVQLLQEVLRLAQHDPAFRLAFEQLLDDSVDLKEPDAVVVVNPGPLRVADLLDLFQYATIVLEEHLDKQRQAEARNQEQGAADGSAPELSSAGPTDSSPAGPFEVWGYGLDPGQKDPGRHGYRSTRRGGARSCAPADRHQFSGT